LVAGHLTIYITRSVGTFWQRPWPNWRLVVATEGNVLKTVEN
jgi:H+-transporting ATPase